MKQRTRNLKNSQTAVTVRDIYVTVTVTFVQSERSNWRTTRYEPAEKISARSNGGRNSSSNSKIPVLKRNAENVAAVWDEFLSSQTTSARSERSDWSHTKYESAEKISSRSNGEKVSVAAESFWTKLSLSLIFSLSFLSLSVSAAGYHSVWKTLKVNIGLDVHIGSEPNPTNLPLTTMWRWSTNRQFHNKFQTWFSVAP